MEHTVFQFNRWRGIKHVASADLGSELNPGKMIDCMVETSNNWMTICSTCLLYTSRCV